MQEHVEGYHELSAKTKIFFSTAVAKWDAEFYIKVDDDVHVNLGESLNLWHLGWLPLKIMSYELTVLSSPISSHIALPGTCVSISNTLSLFSI